MPRRRTGRPRGRPSQVWGEWCWQRDPDPDAFDLLAMLLIAKDEPIQPYALAKKLDAVSPQMRHRDNIKLGNKLTTIIKISKLIIHTSKNDAPRRSLKEVWSGNYTDEEIRQHALEIVKEHILDSSLTPSEYRRLREAEIAIEEAEAVIDEMREKYDRVLEQIEQLDAFIKNRTKPLKSTILNE